MNFTEFNEKCNTEADCITLFIKIYYLDNLYCTICFKTDKLSTRKNTAKNFQCNHCNKSFSVFSNTPLYDTHIDFRKWLYAFYLLTGITSALKPNCARQLALLVSINYRSAYRLLFLLKKILKERDTKLIGTLIEMNDKIINGYLLTSVIFE